jgi:hypothetical protein
LPTPPLHETAFAGLAATPSVQKKGIAGVRNSDSGSQTGRYLLLIVARKRRAAKVAALPQTVGSPHGKLRGKNAVLAWFGELNAKERRTMGACFGGWALDAFDVQMYSFVIPTVIALWGL